MAITKIIANTPQTPNNSDAQDWASMLNAIVGDVSGVLTYGSELEVEIVNDNKIKIKDGVYSLQGHMIRNHEGTDLELTVNSGTLGVKRIDLLVVTYEKNINNQQDDVFEFEVVQGDAIASNDGDPTPPSITQNDLLEGGTKRQEVLYELHLNETTLSLVDKREFVTSVHELEDRIEAGFDDVADYVVETGSNENGSWEKWNSGKLEQWDTVEGITGGTGLISKPYPTQEFISVPLTFSTSVYNGGGTGLAKFITEHPQQNSYRAYVLLEGRVVTGEPVKINYYAIGRWK